MIRRKEPDALASASELVEIGKEKFYQLTFKHPDTKCPLSHPGHFLYYKRRYSTGVDLDQALHRLKEKKKLVPICNRCSRKYEFSYAVSPTTTSHPVSM